MPNNLNRTIWLIGTGQMSIDYLNVLLAQDLSFEVVGRSETSALSFFEKTNYSPYVGGLKNHINTTTNIPEMAIVAVGVEDLAENTILLIKSGVKNILVEKPAGYNSKEIKQIMDYADAYNSNVFVAYNRRFYSSTDKAIEIITEDGGVKSFIFEFTEWGHIISKLNNSKKLSDAWLLANSSHVIDLAFFLGGLPDKISCFSGGGLDWHKTSSIYSGAGVTQNRALFSYQANWGAPGRWSIEVMTDKHRLILKPLEELYIQNIGSIHVQKLEIDDALDKKFKAGLYMQVKSFVNNINYNKLLTISNHYKNSLIYDKIENK